MSLPKVLFLGATIGFALPTFALANIELVTNGGFETGDFTGWTLVGNTGFTTIEPSDVASPMLTGGGSYVAAFGNVGSLGGISQTLATVPGQDYTLSFWLFNQGGIPNSYQVDWAGNTVDVQTDLGAFGWTHFSYSVLGTGTDSTTLTFQFQNDPSYYLLDNVSVMAPEPGVYAVLALGLAGLIIAVRRRKIA
ncbi:MAG: PEP-CTERM sorting domain-containing protein [Bryobacteraceae bacterium]